jgi:hypothetical protein
MGTGRIGALLAAEPGREASSRGGVGTAKLAPPPSPAIRGEAARSGDPSSGELRLPVTLAAMPGRDLASRELAPPNVALAPTAGAGMPKAFPSPANVAVPVRTRAIRNLLSAPDGAAFSASAPSAVRRRIVGARILGVGRRGGGALPTVPKSPPPPLAPLAAASLLAAASPLCSSLAIVNIST